MLRRTLAVVLICVMAGGWLFTSATPVAAADTVNLPVPKVHQQNDPPDDPYADGGWDGSNACGAASAVMLAAYWGKLAPHPCVDCNSNDYSWYVNQQYTNSYGTAFTTAATDDSSNNFWGAFGYIYSGTVKTQAALYLQAHGLVTATDDSPTEAEVKAQLDAGYPVYMKTDLTGGAGHVIVIKGYTDGVPTEYITNNPLYTSDKSYNWTLMKVGWMITAQPATDQTWYLSNFSAGSNRFYMYREDTSKGAGTVTINEGAIEHWIADEAASNSLTFPAANWSVALTFNAAPSTGNSFTGHLGSFDGATYTEEKWWDFTGADGSKSYFTTSFNPDSITVPAGDYLAFWLTNIDDGGISENLVVRGGLNYSCTISPTSDPGYPLPELSTVVLVSIGLVALGGFYVVARRRKTGGIKTSPS